MDSDTGAVAATIGGAKYALKYVWVILLAALGGVASYMQRIEQHHMRFSFFRLITEVIISGFVGILVFLLCATFSIPQIPTAMLVGIGGHMGSRAMNFLEAIFVDWLKHHNFME